MSYEDVTLNERIALWSGFIYTIAIFIALMFIPVYNVAQETMTVVGQSVRTTSAEGMDTIFAVDRSGAITGALVPIILTLIPLLVALVQKAGARWISEVTVTLALVIFVVSGAMTIGLFYLPAVAAMAVAAGIAGKTAHRHGAYG